MKLVVLATIAATLAALTGCPGAPGGSSGCGAQTPVPVGQTVTEQLGSRTYYLHLPSSYQPAQPSPVVLAFHGHNGTGTDIEAFSGMDALDTIAVYPVGEVGTDGETAWEGAPYAAPVDDVKFVSDLLDHLEQTLCVDTHRVFATGKSNGGGFTALLACQLPSRIDAFATVAGAFYPGTSQECAGSPPVPIIDFHGTGDPTIPYNGGRSHGQKLPPLMSWAQGWADHNHCAAPTSHTIGSDVREFVWQPCAGGATVEHYRIAGGGHTWPGATIPSGPSGSGTTTHTISATALIWQFFNTASRAER